MAKLSDDLGKWTSKMLTDFLFTTLDSWKKEYMDKDWEHLKKFTAEKLVSLDERIREAKQEADRARSDCRSLKHTVDKLQEEMEKIKRDLQIYGIKNEDGLR